MVNPTLEGIPTELLTHILCQIPDRASLKSIVLSSPKCYQAYLAVRSKVLFCVWKTQYGDLLDISEAITAVRSEGLLFRTRKEEAIALLDSWRRKDEIRESNQALTSSSRIREPKNLEEIIKLFRLCEVLHYFLDDFQKNVPRPTWMDITRWHNEILPIALSDTEKRRFLRAICRLQILANIYGPPEVALDKIFDSNWDSNYWRDPWIDADAYRLFYGTMPLWEHEEMGCVFSYLVPKYESICKQISEDLRKLVSDTGCFLFEEILPEDQRPPIAYELETVSSLDHFGNHFRDLTSIGPGFLYRVLHAERLLQRNMVMANVRLYAPEANFIGTDIDVSWDDRFPLIYPADRHEAPGFEQRWSTLPPIERPNLGWKRELLLPYTAEQELEDAFKWDRKDEKDWDWGYALWDDERLEIWTSPLNL